MGSGVGGGERGGYSLYGWEQRGGWVVSMWELNPFLSTLSLTLALMLAPAAPQYHPLALVSPRSLVVPRYV